MGLDIFGGGGSDGGGQPGESSGFDVVTLPQYDFTEPRYEALSDFVTSNINNIAEGGIPLWLQNQLPTVREGLTRGLDETYYGLPGQRTGILETERQNAAILGTGGGTATRRVSRALQKYSSQAQDIDRFIAEQTIGGTQQTIGQLGNISAQIPQGPESAIVARGGYSPQQGPNAGGFIGDAFNQGANLLTSLLPGQEGQTTSSPFSLDPFTGNGGGGTEPAYYQAARNPINYNNSVNLAPPTSGAGYQPFQAGSLASQYF